MVYYNFPGAICLLFHKFNTFCPYFYFIPISDIPFGTAYCHITSLQAINCFDFHFTFNGKNSFYGLFKFFLA